MIDMLLCSVLWRATIRKMRSPAVKRKKKIYIFNIIASQRNGKFPWYVCE